MTPEQAIRILDSETSLVAIEELKYYAGFNRDKVIDQIQEAMDMGAEALRETKWIPCSERLPEDGQTIIFSGEDGFVECGSYNAKKNWCENGDYFPNAFEFIAWMPLPEPYKEGDKE